jgi:hypothetical protein
MKTTMSDRKTLITLIVGVAILIALTIPTLARLFGWGGEPDGLTVFRIPNDAIVKIDGRTVGNTVKLEVDKEYVITGEREGWTTFERTIRLNEFNRNIIVVLEPNSDEARKWQESNQSAYTMLEQYAGEEAVAAGEYMRTRYSIINSLTHMGQGYIITYGFKDPSDVDSFFILIRAPIGLRSAAVKRIYNLGFDPADYNIEFTDLNEGGAREH